MKQQISKKQIEKLINLDIDLKECNIGCLLGWLDDNTGDWDIHSRKCDTYFVACEISGITVTSCSEGLLDTLVSLIIKIKHRGYKENYDL